MPEPRDDPAAPAGALATGRSPLPAASRPRILTRRRALGVLAAIGIAHGALLAYFYVGQESLIFHPEPLPADFRFAFDPREQRVDEVRIAVPGGEIDALHFRQPAPRGLVFYLHGNSGNLATWTTHIDFYRRINYDLFMIDYRGFGKSRGTITSEAQLHADVRAAWDRIAPAYAGKPVVILGRSLGTALATRLARDVNPALLVLVTPFTSLLDLARLHEPLAPTWLLKYPLRSDALIGDVRSPVLLIHGTRDTLTPLAHAERLRSLIRSPAQLLVIDGATHDDIHEYPDYANVLGERLEALGR